MTLTHLTASAAHSNAVLLRGLDSSVGTGPGVLSEAEVVVRAHVDDVLHHSARVPERQTETENQYPDSRLMEIIISDMYACLPLVAWQPLPVQCYPLLSQSMIAEAVIQ